jgi:hypothetical protein
LYAEVLVQFKNALGRLRIVSHDSNIQVLKEYFMKDVLNDPLNRLVFCKSGAFKLRMRLCSLAYWWVIKPVFKLGFTTVLAAEAISAFNIVLGGMSREARGGA